MQNELQNENDIYFKKYLKYKKKYSDLKQLIGGGCAIKCRGGYPHTMIHKRNKSICTTCGCVRVNF